MSNHHFDSSKLMCIHGRARGGCAECIEFYKKCDHGQLARTCLLCEMRDENLALRDQVAEQRSALEAMLKTNEQGIIAANRHFETEAKLADCQAVIRARGHDLWCPTAICAYKFSRGICGMREALHDNMKFHAFKPGPCSTECGHDRTTGEKA